MVAKEDENREKLTISVAELAKMLGISRGVAYQLSRAEGFPILKLGKRTLIPKNALIEWIQNNSQKGA